jgi:predicted O-methyltransferase YrrM
MSQWRVRLRAVETNGHDSVAMLALASLPGPFLPWTNFSMRPAAILAVLSDIAIYDRQSVMECGSGNSTIFAARLLAQRGSGHITSLEHAGAWSALTQRLLEQQGLTDWARVISAPLVDGWYDRAQIPSITPIDLLVVDGPPAWARDRREARRPALDHFAERLTDNATVILDDAWRAGERRVINRWSESHGRRFRLDPGGFAISAPHVT